MKIYNTKRAGISLVALVVTIIVLIILTAAVIVTFMEGGIVDRAKEAVFKSDIKTYQEILTVKRAEEQIEIAVGTGGTSALNGETAEEIQVFMPEFKEEYEGIIIVVDGEIMLAKGYVEVATELQQEWIEDLSLKKVRNVITFTYNSPNTGAIENFQAYEGMTWQQWYESGEFETGNIFVAGNTVGYINGLEYAWTYEQNGETVYYEPVCEPEWIDNTDGDWFSYIVSPTDTIRADASYATGWA